MPDQVRYGLLLRASLEVLDERGGVVPKKELLARVEQRVVPNSVERVKQSNGAEAWVTAIGYHTGNAATVGWLVKGPEGWQLTSTGRTALQRFQGGEALLAESSRQYREVFRRRKAARAKLSALTSVITDLLEGLPPGSWTSYDDVALVVEAEPSEIADLLADQAFTNSYRVLKPDGTVPEAEFQHANYRGTDLRQRLTNEGVEFDELAHADQDQRITGEALRARLAEVAEEPARTRRAWLVRGSNVRGIDLVPTWLAEGWCSLEASKLTPVDPAADAAELRKLVDTAYDHKDYSSRERLLREVDAFLRRMRVDDIVLTVRQGSVYIGLVTGEPEWVESEGDRSNLRRAVRWLRPDQPLDLVELPPPLPALTGSQDDVIDLTEALDAVERLVAERAAEQSAPPVEPELAFPTVTAELAGDLLIDLDWLTNLVELLWDRRQVILYGPPGTGKTYLAQKLAQHLTEDRAIELVQFHPSYTYEDFFEGYRPKVGTDSRMEFDLVPGPFRRLADTARDRRSTPHILIIDEINRGNLAKIFGELYFLLEYRDQAITLQYRAKEFWLPHNVFVIGTMNTADRSIALVDAAMRRRFAFEEMHPRRAPVAGLLRRWLARRDGITTDAAELLDELNTRIEDPEYAIGPSYLMKEHIYLRPQGLDRVWRTDLLPLLTEHHYGEAVDIEDRYGLTALRTALGTTPATVAP